MEKIEDINVTNAILKKSFDFSIESLLRTDRKQQDFGSSRGVQTVDFDLDSNHSSPESATVLSRSMRLFNSKSTKTSWDVGHSARNLGEMTLESTDLMQMSESDGDDKKSPTFSWLNCTRFKPPKLPRSRKRGVFGKRVGRGPRIPFSPHQIALLENTFTNSQYLSSESITRLGNELQLSETRVKIWFQNRRARYRRERDAMESGQNGTDASTQKLLSKRSHFPLPVPRAPGHLVVNSSQNIQYECNKMNSPLNLSSEKLISSSSSRIYLEKVANAKAIERADRVSLDDGYWVNQCQFPVQNYKIHETSLANLGYLTNNPNYVVPKFLISANNSNTLLSGGFGFAEYCHMHT